ncbi:MAG: histidine phosphatase family protein [Alkalinema sp. RL_2_19]|nr:histidine phosphatase family protein [Alkalinema sp. RL_2_19]
MTTTVILVRHGRSHYNEIGRFQGSSDESHLTLEGFETAQLTGQFLQQFAIDHTFVSPLQRAQRTMTAMRSANPTIPTATSLDKLREIDLPEWQGRFYRDVRANLPEAYKQWKMTPDRFTMRTEDIPSATAFFPVIELFDRAQALWQQLIPPSDDQTLLIVSHGGTIQALIATALGLPSTVFHRIQQCNCGVSVLQFNHGLEAPAQLQHLNDTRHLNQALPKLKEGKRGLRHLLLVGNDVRSAPQVHALEQLAAHSARPGVMTGIRTQSPQQVRQQIQTAWGINSDSSTLNADRLHLASGAVCVLHQPESLNYTIVQSIWPASLALSKPAPTIAAH